MTTTWAGTPPKECDTCDTPITTKFYDAKTFVGIWACMCPSCFNLGPGLGKLGTGFGQEYSKKNGQFVKTGG